VSQLAINVGGVSLQYYCGHCYEATPLTAEREGDADGVDSENITTVISFYTFEENGVPRGYDCNRKMEVEWILVRPTVTVQTNHI